MSRIILIIALILMLMAAPGMAGDIPVPDIETVRMLLLQPDMDFTIFEGEELCTTLIYLIENDGTELRDRVVHRALCALPETGDERAVEYLVEYIDEHPLDCLYGLGEFSTLESCEALLAHIEDDDEFTRRFAAQSLGNLDYTVSDEMWALRDRVLEQLAVRIEEETEEWMLPIIEDAHSKVAEQVREEGEAEIPD